MGSFFFIQGSCSLGLCYLCKASLVTFIFFFGYFRGFVLLSVVGVFGITDCFLGRVFGFSFCKDFGFQNQVVVYTVILRKVFIEFRVRGVWEIFNQRVFGVRILGCFVIFFIYCFTCLVGRGTFDIQGVTRGLVKWQR